MELQILHHSRYNPLYSLVVLSQAYWKGMHYRRMPIKYELYPFPSCLKRKKKVFHKAVPEPHPIYGECFALECAACTTVHRKTQCYHGEDKCREANPMRL